MKLLEKYRLSNLLDYGLHDYEKWDTIRSIFNNNPFCRPYLFPCIHYSYSVPDFYKGYRLIGATGLVDPFHFSNPQIMKTKLRISTFLPAFFGTKKLRFGYDKFVLQSVNSFSVYLRPGICIDDRTREPLILTYIKQEADRYYILVRISKKLLSLPQYKELGALVTSKLIPLLTVNNVDSIEKVDISLENELAPLGLKRRTQDSKYTPFLTQSEVKTLVNEIKASINLNE